MPPFSEIWRGSAAFGVIVKRATGAWFPVSAALPVSVDATVSTTLMWTAPVFRITTFWNT